MQRKYKRLLFVGASFLGASIFLLSSYFIVKKTKQNNLHLKNQKEQYISIVIKGAVFFPGEYSFKKGVKFYEILAKAKLKPHANIKNINFNAEIFKNITINISFDHKRKINIKEIKNFNQIINFGIRKNIAIKIFSFIKENNYQISWEKLEQLNGIGLKTIQILKQKLIL